MTGLYKIGADGSLKRVYLVRAIPGGVEWLPGDEPTGPVRLGITRARVLGLAPPVRLGVARARVLGFPPDVDPDPEPDPDPVRLGVTRARVLAVPAQAVDPEPDPDPEPTGDPLPWGLPADWDPTVVPAQALVTIDTPGDYLIQLPGGEPLTTRMEVYVPSAAPDGIRVAIIGGHIDTTGMQEWALRLNLQGARFTHVEGVRISGEDNRDGIRGDFRHPESVVQIQNVQIDRLHGDSEYHADVIQIWSGPSVLRVQGVHGVTDYQGIVLHPRQFGPWLDNPEWLGQWDLRDIYVEFVDDAAGTAYYSWHDEPTGNPQIATQGLYSTADRTLPPNISSGSPGVWADVNVGQAPTGSLFTATPGAGYTPTGYDPPPEPEPDPVLLGVTRARVMAVPHESEPEQHAASHIISAGGDDGHCTATSLTVGVGTFIVGDPALRPFVRFVVDAQRGAQIDSAILRLRKTTAPSGTGFAVAAAAVDHAPTPGSAGDVWNAVTTTAHTVADIPATAHVDFTIDVTAVVQEIVNRPGWEAGNGVLLLIDGGTTDGVLRIAAYEHADATPQLDVEWTTYGPPPVLVPTRALSPVRQVRGITARQVDQARSELRDVIDSTVISFDWRDAHDGLGQLNPAFRAKLQDDLDWCSANTGVSGQPIRARLRPMMGMYTPQWVRDTAGEMPWYTSDGNVGTGDPAPSDPNWNEVPGGTAVWWTPEYLDAAEDLYALIAAEFATHPALYEVVMGWPTTQFAEPLTRQFGLQENLEAVVAAGWTDALDDAAFEAGWASHVAHFSPHDLGCYTAYNPAGTVIPGTPPTFQHGSTARTIALMERQIEMLGRHAVIANNSWVAPMTQHPVAYQTMYAHMRSIRHRVTPNPVAFQTETLVKHIADYPTETVRGTVEAAVEFGAGSVEIPIGAQDYNDLYPENHVTAVFSASVAPGFDANAAPFT